MEKPRAAMIRSALREAGIIQEMKTAFLCDSESVFDTTETRNTDGQTGAILPLPLLTDSDRIARVLRSPSGAKSDFQTVHKTFQIVDLSSCLKTSAKTSDLLLASLLIMGSSRRTSMQVLTEIESNSHNFSVIHMKIATRFATALVALFIAVAPTFGQTAQDAAITVSHPGFDGLKADLKGILDLTLPAEQEQWENIEGYIDTLSEGVDQKRSVYVSVITGTKPNSTLMWIPLEDKKFNAFRENLESLGYEVNRDDKDANLYTLDQDPEGGLVRLIPASGYCGVILTNDKSALPVLKKMLAGVVPPANAVEGNMIAELTNSDESEAAQKHRRESYAEVRRVSLEAIKKRPSESSTEFELRRLLVDQQMDEGERLFAESSRLSATLKIDKANPAAIKVDILSTARAIAGTGLDQAIRQIGTQPDAFASIAKEKGSALSLRLNHPIDPMRQQNFTEFLDALQKDLDVRIAGSKERSESEKTAITKSAKGILDVLRASIKAGWANVFVESVPDGKGDFYSIVGFVAPSAPDLNAVLPELAAAAKGSVVEMNVDKQGEVSIHRIVMAEGLSDLFDRVFGVKKDLFVGVGASQIWIASGLDSKERMKKTIAGLGAPANSPAPLHVEVNLLPIMQRLDDIAKTDAPGKTPEEQESQRSRARTRARALAAMKDGGDEAVMTFKVDNGEITGNIHVETGVLRWVGKMMSAFSKENLE
jgi:hypothetical protein